MSQDGIVFLLILLSSLLSVTSSYRCSNRLYRGQRLLPGEHLCSRNLNYRMFVNETNGQVNISESFPRVNYYKAPPPTLFSTQLAPTVPQYLTVSDSGDFLAVGIDNTVYWNAGVSDGSFLELQDTGVAVLFAVNTTNTVVKWKSPSMYSLRLAGGGQTVGRLEVFYNNTWGTVCNSAFDNYDATVACMTLGFQSGVSASNSYGAGSGPIWLTKMKCRNTEDNLQQCAFNDDEKTWGDTSCTHSSDVAVNCTGTWTLGVPSPLQHVCISRLYVGQSLSLGESLCGGTNGEYALRLTNKFGDTSMVFEEKGKKRWVIGWKANTPAGVKVTLDTDGVLRLIGAAAGLPYSLFSQNVTDASFLEIQDDGVVKVVSKNGTVGWKKAAGDYCYEEMKQADFSTAVSDVAASFMTCSDMCSSDVTCKAFTYSESCEVTSNNRTRGVSWCVTKNAVRWAPNAGLHYYEKTVGCPSGSSCYRYVGNMNSGGQEINNTIVVNLTACFAVCDNEPRCTNIVWEPGTPRCWMKWLRMNESRGSYQWDYYARLNCTPVDPQSISTLPPKSCPIKLQANSYLLKGERLCSPNGQHVVTVEADGRLLLDGGQWSTGSSSGLTSALLLTDMQLILRLDDSSVKWSFDWSRQTLTGSLCYLAVSDTGLLQIVNSYNFTIWNHVQGSLLQQTFPTPYGSPTAVLFLDGSNSSCTALPLFAAIGLGTAPFNSSFPVTVVGTNMHCDANNIEYVLLLPKEMSTNGNGGLSGRSSNNNCQLLGGSATTCRFQCRSQGTSFATIFLHSKCAATTSTLCEILLQ